MTLDFPRTIGDGYPEYADDELGYEYHAWEVVSASELRDHERIRRARRSQLEEVVQQFRPLSDPLRWALARRHLRDGDRERYYDQLRHLVDGDHDHPALRYPEILADLARRRAEDGDLDEARAVIDRIQNTWPELEDALPLLDAQLLLLCGRPDDAHQAFDKALAPYEHDVDLRIETAADFERAEAFELARTWLERARALADELGDTASLVDIDLMEHTLPSDDERVAPTDDD